MNFGLEVSIPNDASGREVSDDHVDERRFAVLSAVFSAARWTPSISPPPRFGLEAPLGRCGDAGGAKLSLGISRVAAFAVAMSIS